VKENSDTFALEYQPNAGATEAVVAVTCVMEYSSSQSATSQAAGIRS